ncbi:UNVERIFIED_CONTAM: hypothetical protein FKN15_054251 [Acipenser sinensis]
MDESMDEDASFEMMDDHNHNNWEASADAYRQHPPNPQQQTGHAAHSTVCEAEGSTLPNSGAHSAPEPGNGVGDCEDSAGTGASAGASASAGGKVTLNINSSTSKFSRMDESMDEDASFEMMDDHNHNNWEASADAYRQHPPNPQQQTGHAAHSTVCEAEGSTLPNSGAHSAPGPGNGVGDCEDSAGTGASAGASAAAGGKVTLNINSSTSKFSRMDESMDEDASFEMMDDHNHNNWEASADAYRQHPPNPQQQTGHAAHSTVCEAEGSTLPNSGAHSAPEPGNGVGDCEDSAGTGASAGASASAGGKVTLNINSSTSKFLMNVITTEDYKSTYWPKLESAIEQLLTQNPQDYIPISYEQIYSCVYKCVCQQHSEQMYNDLIHKITGHLQHISEELQLLIQEHHLMRLEYRRMYRLIARTAARQDRQ